MGKVLQIDSPTRLYEVPKVKEVADFIGTINFFNATIKGKEGGTTVVEAEGLGKVHSSASNEDTGSSGSTTVAIRPEKFNISFQQPNVQTNVCEGVLQAAAYLGDRSHYYVKVKGREAPVAVASQNAQRQMQAVEADNQQKVWLTWDENSVLLLSK